ncbi:monocyte chemotactic protein 1B-like [Engraulis encrasicolus]|uniref:monocyte chemotactic protein 1B-like n=1 Tax=Engraulis encrasicolus TaxID=184585 RepID=UPI002FD15CBA
MKLCCAVAVAVAVLVLALCSQGDSQTAVGPDKCCFEFYSKKLPANKINAYKMTRADCPKPGVILTTVGNKEICANPKVKQIQAIIEKIDNLFGTQTTTGAP